MMTQLMTRQEEFTKEIGARMDQLEVEKVKKPKVENLDDEDEPIWDKEDRNDYDKKKSTIADKVTTETLEIKEKMEQLKIDFRKA